MKRFRRALIWTFTFAFGLIWILAFFLPKEIGGGIDRHGMYAPDLFGKRLYYTTGSRPAPGPLREHNRGGYLVMMDLDATERRERMFGLSPFRNDDYYGAKRPTVFETADGFAALYLGVGKDGRRRVCLAESSDGNRWTPRKDAVFEPPSDVAPTGLTSYTAAEADAGFLLFYIVSGGVVRSAFSPDLENWTDNGVFLTLPEPESVLGFAPLPDGRVLIVSRVGARPPFVSIGVPADGQLTDRRWAGGSTEGVPGGIAMGEPLFTAPFLQEIVDVRVSVDGGVWRALVTGGAGETDARLRTAVFEGPSLEEVRLVPNSQPDGSVVALGGAAFSTRFDGIAGAASNFVPVVMTFGFGLGLISLLYVHGRRLAKGGDGRFYSGVVLGGLLVMVVVQFGHRISGAESGFWWQMNQLFFMRLQFPLGATMFGLLAAYLVSAAYRAFRIRTFDAAVLTAMAALVVLTQVPMGQFVGSLISPDAVQVGAAIDAQAAHARNWALLIANDAVQRAVGFGAFVGAIAMAMRVWLSLDKTSLE